MTVAHSTRQLVFARALHLCEYCLLHESDSYLPHQIEHIISRKHHGGHSLFNLACVCFLCNRFKGPDLSTVLLPDLEVIRFYRPRSDRWLEHFQLNGNLILPQSKIGEATVKILQLNSRERLEEREILVAEGSFPHPAVAQYWLNQQLAR